MARHLSCLRDRRQLAASAAARATAAAAVRAAAVALGRADDEPPPPAAHQVARRLGESAPPHGQPRQRAVPVDLARRGRSSSGENIASEQLRVTVRAVPVDLARASERAGGARDGEVVKERPSFRQGRNDRTFKAGRSTDRETP